MLPLFCLAFTLAPIDCRLCTAKPESPRRLGDAPHLVRAWRSDVFCRQADRQLALPFTLKTAFRPTIAVGRAGKRYLETKTRTALPQCEQIVGVNCLDAHFLDSMAMAEPGLSGATRVTPASLYSAGAGGVRRGVVRHADLDYQVLSAGQGAPLIMLHGGGSSAAHFAQLMALLSGRYRAIAYDQQGFGKTGAQKETPIDHAGWSGDVIAIMDRLDLKSAALIGWSMGASVALNTAARWPDRISRLFLLGAPSPVSSVDVEALRARHQKLISMDHARRRDLIRRELANRVAQSFQEQADFLDRLVDQYFSTDFDLHARIIDAYATRPDLYRIARRTACPVHIIVGAEDGVTPPDAAQKMAALLSDATLDVISDCGHYYAEEQPAAIAGVIAGRMPG